MIACIQYSITVVDVTVWDLACRVVVHGHFKNHPWTVLQNFADRNFRTLRCLWCNDSYLNWFNTVSDQYILSSSAVMLVAIVIFFVSL